MRGVEERFGPFGLVVRVAQVCLDGEGDGNVGCVCELDAGLGGAGVLATEAIWILRVKISTITSNDLSMKPWCMI